MPPDRLHRPDRPGLCRLKTQLKGSSRVGIENLLRILKQRQPFFGLLGREVKVVGSGSLPIVGKRPKRCVLTLSNLLPELSKFSGQAVLQHLRR
jgi:hypothetical protein